MPIPLAAPATTAKSWRHCSLSPAQIMDIARAREAFLSRLLMAYISSGLVFMLLPGTFLGVWNLLQISGRESAGSISPAWLQVHGAALVLLTTECTLRVSSEVLAYQGYADWAWSLLPVSALLELAGITVFAVNICGTFILEPSHVQKQPLVVGTS